VATVLVVDDDAAIRETVALALATAGHRVVRAASVAEARARVAETSPDLVISDIYMPGGSGVELLAELAASDEPPAVILMTARGTVETAAAAARIGAFDYLAKPFDLKVLLARVAAALARPAATPAAADAGPETHIVGSDPVMVEVYKAVARVAALPVPVLLLGETGTGKELVARALHRHGARPDGPFVPVNCGAIPDTLLESELFGHLRGAFTDARRDRRGALAAAHGGTVFLDEVGEVSPSFQVKLLRFLEDGTVRPVGADAGVRVTTRVVSATNRDLPALAAAGEFRQDLYYRLAGYEIRLPPLRERLADLPALVEHFRSALGDQLGQLQAGAATPGVLAILAAHPWPGNVRELAQVVRRLLIDTGGLSDEDAVRRVLASPPPGGTAKPSPASATTPPATTLDDVERQQIERVLRACSGNRSEAARRLGIDRKTLARKLRRYGTGLESPEDGRD